MSDGTLAGSGTHEELMASCEEYREIYESQSPSEKKAAAAQEVRA